MLLLAGEVVNFDVGLLVPDGGSVAQYFLAFLNEFFRRLFMIGKAEYVFLHEFLGIDRLKADRWGHVNSLHESKSI